MEGTCGALIGAVSMLGLINKNSPNTMQSSRKMMNAFKEQMETVIYVTIKKGWMES